MERAEERDSLRLARTWGSSPKAINGWTPTYVTDYEYDGDGRLVRSITRQVEPEWDDHSRALAEALERYDKDCCPGCGTHSSIEYESTHLTFEERFCGFCADQERHARVIAERDDAETPRDKDGHLAWPDVRARRPADGRHLFIRPLNRDELQEMGIAPSVSRRKGV